MAKRMKIITAGNLRKVVMYTPVMPRDGPVVRAQRSRATTEAQKRMNDKTARAKLELTLAANFTGRDLFCTLTYGDKHLPPTKEAAEGVLRAFVRVLREDRKRHGQALKYAYVTENDHGDRRIHHHIIINATGRDIETIRSLWTHGDQVDIEPLYRKTWEAHAEYMTKEGGGRPVGKRMWTPSRNLDKPKVTSCWVPEGTRIDVPWYAQDVSWVSGGEGAAAWEYVKYTVPPQYENQDGPERYFEDAELTAYLARSKL